MLLTAQSSLSSQAAKNPLLNECKMHMCSDMNRLSILFMPEKKYLKPQPPGYNPRAVFALKGIKHAHT